MRTLLFGVSDRQFISSLCHEVGPHPLSSLQQTCMRVSNQTLGDCLQPGEPNELVVAASVS
jgi:hypothetical protein